MSQSRYEQEEYLEQNDDEIESAARVKKLVVLGVLAVLVAIGLVVVGKLRVASRVEDCLLAHGAHCDDLVEPPKPAGVR
jgi:hypothetical protein